MRKLEADIVQGAREMLQSHAARLKGCGISWQEPEIEVWRYESELYASEIRITLRKRGQIYDVLEFHIYRDGKPLVSKQEALSWINQQLTQQT